MKRGGFFDVLIVGAGHGGAQAAIALRQRKFVGTIAILGDELDPPYERPPLSKDYLAGGKPFEPMLIRPFAFWQERAIALLLGRRGGQVDPQAHLLMTADGATFGHGTLIWATVSPGHGARNETASRRRRVMRTLSPGCHMSRPGVSSIHEPAH